MDFDMLGLAPRLLKKIAEQGLVKPTPIQTQAIPHALNGRDVMGLAQTGTGKTAAFGLPLIHILSTAGVSPASKTVHGLILAPTRELAKQIFDNLRNYTQGSHLKVALTVGGVSIGKQINVLGRGTDLLVATPGRLLDLIDRKAVSLSETHFLVLDEADQMLDLGFIHALRRIAPLLPTDRQTMLFSATMPKQMAELSQAYLTDPIRVEVSPPGKAADKIKQSVHFVRQNEKQTLLVKLLSAHPDERTLVFGRTKHGSEKLMRNLEKAGFAADSIHGNKSQGQRDRAIKAFKAGTVKVLVATDVAARGLDIPGVAYVYNYDLPNVPDNFVHRIGRTARAGKSGEAIAFCSPDEMDDLKAIQKTMGLKIAVAGGAPWEPAQDEKPAKKPWHKRRGGGKPNNASTGPKPGRKPRRGGPKSTKGRRGPKRAA
jgi:ATP-dependent RNA helicase RhlE